MRKSRSIGWSAVSAIGAIASSIVLLGCPDNSNTTGTSYTCYCTCTDCIAQDFWTGWCTQRTDPNLGYPYVWLAYLPTRCVAPGTDVASDCRAMCNASNPFGSCSYDLSFNGLTPDGKTQASVVPNSCDPTVASSAHFLKSSDQTSQSNGLQVAEITITHEGDSATTTGSLTGPLHFSESCSQGGGCALTIDNMNLTVADTDVGGVHLGGITISGLSVIGTRSSSAGAYDLSGSSALLRATASASGESQNVSYDETTYSTGNHVASIDAVGVLEVWLDIAHPTSPGDTTSIHIKGNPADLEPVALISTLPSTFECDPQINGASVHLDASGSVGRSAPIASYYWMAQELPPLGTAVQFDKTFAVGSYHLAVRVTDDAGRTNNSYSQFSVVDTSAPIIQLSEPERKIDACSTSALTIPTPTASDCSATTVTGTVVMRDGVALSEPFSGTVPAYPGKTTIRWSATDANGKTSTADQVINVSPSLTGTQYVAVDDRAIVYNHGSVFGPILAGRTNIGVTGQVGDIFSRGQVTLADRAYVWGNIYTPIPISRGNGVTFPGSVIVQTPTIPTLPAVSVTPGTVDITFTNGTASPPPGAYRYANVNSGNTLNLAPGVYSFTSLIVNSAATLHITPSSTPTVIQIKSDAAIRGVTPTNIDPATLQIKVAGSNSVYVEPNFTGSILAPNANVTVGVGSGSTFSGSIRALSIELRPDVRYYCLVD